MRYPITKRAVKEEVMYLIRYTVLGKYGRTRQEYQSFDRNYDADKESETERLHKHINDTWTVYANRGESVLLTEIDGIFSKPSELLFSPYTPEYKF